jgi:NarL family two-component system response regulator LiaR
VQPEQLGSRSQPARLVIADDHELAREGLRAMLEHEPDLEVVGEATTGREALEVCRRLQPDLVLMDVRMPDMDGLAAAQAIKEEWPRISILAITLSEDPDYLLRALKVGVAGYVLKDASRADVVAAVRRALGGESPIDQRLSVVLLRRLAEDRRTPAAPSGPGLTPREQEVLRLVAEGKTNAAIAERLFVSVSTVKVNVEHIIDKLGVSDRTQAAVRAIELGLIGPPSKMSS